MNEKKIATDLLSKLEPHFHIETEVRGKHFSGKSMKIDAVLKPKDPSGWKNPDLALGLEFKDCSHFEQGDCHIKDYTKWLAQSLDYASTDFDNYGYLHIFGYRMFQFPEFLKWKHLSHLMHQFGLGELNYHSNNGLAFFLSGTHAIWSEKIGVQYGKLWSLNRKFGSR